MSPKTTPSAAMTIFAERPPLRSRASDDWGARAVAEAVIGLLYPDVIPTPHGNEKGFGPVCSRLQRNAA